MEGGRERERRRGRGERERVEPSCEVQRPRLYIGALLIHNYRNKRRHRLYDCNTVPVCLDKTQGIRGAVVGWVSSCCCSFPCCSQCFVIFIGNHPSTGAVHVFAVPTIIIHSGTL